MFTTRPAKDQRLEAQRFFSAKSAKSSFSCASTHASCDSEQREAEQCLDWADAVDTDSEDLESLDGALAPRSRSSRAPEQPLHCDTDSEELLDMTDSELMRDEMDLPWHPQPGLAPWQTSSGGCWDWAASADAQAPHAVPPHGPCGDGDGDGLVAAHAPLWASPSYSTQAMAYAPLMASSALAKPVHSPKEHDFAFGELSCPALARGPVCAGGPEVTAHHRLHDELRGMGSLSPDRREFVKTKFEKRLSVLTESQIQTGGTHRYLVQFTGGAISGADGVGFVFSNRLPCPKNIQLITSIFVNRAGRICMRSGRDVVPANRSVRRWELGDHIELRVDLDSMVATFLVWPRSGHAPSVATFDFGASFALLGSVRASVPRRSGYFAAVVQNIGVSIALRS